MPSTFLGLNTSYRGLVAANSGLNVTANNIANIETEGYSRQVVSQTASKAIQTHTSYGCVGTGVDVLATERVRDVFYDIKYWNNNSKLGEVEKKQYYAAQIETYLNDTKGTNAVEGFTTLFDEYTAALESLSTNTGDSSYAADFIGTAGNLCEYFNLLYNNFQNMQTDINDEIKICVDELNGIASEIATLNKEINIIEMDGVSIANELRDKRDLLIDELSSIVDVDVEEVAIKDDKTGEETGVNNYIVRIAGGQTLVDGYEYRQLECVPRDRYSKVNQNEVDGLYDVCWTDSGEEMGVFGTETQGELKGLFEMRDGNNGEAFNGKVTEVNDRDQTVTVTVSDDYLLDMSKTTLPLEDGKITINGTTYYYSSWSFEKESEDATTATYTFVLNQDRNELNGIADITSAEVGEPANVGEQVEYQGVAYYLEQMNEWCRDYAAAFNEIYGVENATDYRGETHEGEQFYSGVDETTGEDYTFNVDGGIDALTYCSTDYGYFKLTAGNFNVCSDIEDDPESMVTHTIETGGISKYDIVENMKALATDETMMSFRGCAAEDFLVCLMGDAALNAESANNFESIYSDIADTISTNRTSISGVDADEEAANMIMYQTAYNLSSKMISVLCEVYDKLIEETGV